MTISPAARARIELGTRIAKQLKPLKSAEQVGRELGLSHQSVYLIEKLALAKLAMEAYRLYGDRTKVF
jgi:hypothetical protein